jgi:hypothetical protein
MRQRLARRSCTRRGLSAVARAQYVAPGLRRISSLCTTVTVANWSVTIGRVPGSVASAGGGARARRAPVRRAQPREHWAAEPASGARSGCHDLWQRGLRVRARVRARNGCQRRNPPEADSVRPRNALRGFRSWGALNRIEDTVLGGGSSRWCRRRRSPCVSRTATFAIGCNSRHRRAWPAQRHRVYPAYVRLRWVMNVWLVGWCRTKYRSQALRDPLKMPPEQ